MASFEIGDAHAVALTHVGEVFTYGWNDKGQLGCNRTTDATHATNSRRLQKPSVVHASLFQVGDGFTSSMWLLRT